MNLYLPLKDGISKSLLLSLRSVDIELGLPVQQRRKIYYFYESISPEAQQTILPYEIDYKVNSPKLFSSTTDLPIFKEGIRPSKTSLLLHFYIIEAD